jgi:diguanylate cyclase (GGDEF)-like protein
MRTPWRLSHNWWRELMNRYQQARWLHLLVGLLVCLATLATGLYAQQMELREQEARRRVELITLGASLRASLTRELSSVLYLSSGLRSYLTVRHATLAPEETQRILANLYESASHVRNFGVAVGLTLSYVYPLQGNEQALGLYYPSVARQWPSVKQVIDSRQPLLVGPMPLVQGGVGMVYRVPVIVDDRYWGLVSTVIDVPSLLRAAMTNVNLSDVDLALRGRDGRGLEGEVFQGSPLLFEQPDAVYTDVEVPGGKWVIALALKAAPAEFPVHWASPRARVWLWRALTAVLALTLGLATTTILSQRSLLLRMAWRDMLTGLPNRQLIEDRIQLGLARHRRNTSLFAVLFIDLDGFKRVNDKLGHKAGDAMLKEAADKLQLAVRATDLVGRWGGDEFVVVLDGGDRVFVDTAVERIRRALELVVQIDGRPYQVGASIGVGRIPEDGRSVAAVVRAADMRMYRDKAQRKRDGVQRESQPASSLQDLA